MSLVWHIRSSERGTETFGHWSDTDTVDRQRRSTEKFGHWMDTVDRQRGASGMLGDWFDTVDRQSGVLICLVTGWTRRSSEKGY